MTFNSEEEWNEYVDRMGDTGYKVSREEDGKGGYKYLA
jgi:hypothetical protein